MKQYRLAAWPELCPPFHGISYRRMLSDMSHRHVTLTQLAGTSRMRRRDVRKFVMMLCDRGLIVERIAAPQDSMFSSLRPLGGWLRRSVLRALAARNRQRHIDDN